MSRLGGGHPGHGQCEQHHQRDLHLDSVRELGTVTRITGHLSGISLFLTIHCWDCLIEQITIAITALCYHFLYCASKQGKFQGKDGSISPFSFTFWIFLNVANLWRDHLRFEIYTLKSWHINENSNKMMKVKTKQIKPREFKTTTNFN